VLRVSQTIEIIRLNHEQIEAERDQILDVYGEAFASPPYNRREIDTENFSRTLTRHMERKDFRLLAAWESKTGKIVGFNYGYTSAPGQWWHDLVEGAMTPQAAREWLTDTFEFVELAVTPGAQGRGVGSRLHDTLLTGLYHRRAVLSTMQAETVALKLYRKRGWITLLETFYFPGTSKPYQIMGLYLSDSRFSPKKDQRLS
jgi:ribosomal protein S18 acetylase RimI-like enzyme